MNLAPAPRDAVHIRPPPDAVDVQPHVNSAVAPRQAVAAGGPHAPPEADVQPVISAAEHQRGAEEDMVDAVALLKEVRVLYSCLVAMSGPAPTFDTLATRSADVLLSVAVASGDFHRDRTGTDGTAATYKQLWGDGRLNTAELRAWFVAKYPLASDDPAVTGALVPGLLDVPSRCVRAGGGGRARHLCNKLPRGAQVLFAGTVYLLLRMCTPQDAGVCGARQARGTSRSPQLALGLLCFAAALLFL